MFILSQSISHVRKADSLLLEGRQAHHSKFELIRTDDVLEERRDSVIKVVRVLRFQDFMKEFKSTKEGFPHLVDISISDETLDDFDVFFFR